MSEEANVAPQALPEALPETKRSISIIWLLPILAAAIGGWLFYKSIINAPVKVVIQFKTAEGITADKTKAFYKGLPAGKVSEVALSREGDAVNVKIEFDPSLEHLIRQKHQVLAGDAQCEHDRRYWFGNHCFGQLYCHAARRRTTGIHVQGTEWAAAAG
jgi:hypothetical protein